MTSLEHLQSLYNRSQFLEAFRQSSEYWTPSTQLDDLSTDELIFAGRLAVRLGGRRLSRHLLRTALKRDPKNPRVRYFTSRVYRRGWRHFDELRAVEIEPDLGGDDAELRASWFAYYAVIWAYHRDFHRAHDFIARARALQADEDWVFSCEADILGYEDRWNEALIAAERAWELNPGSPYAAQSLGASLLNLGRVSESAQRLAAAAENSESFEVTHIAVWHCCAHAETLDPEERSRALQLVRQLAENIPSRMPLADRESSSMFAAIMLDLASMADDHKGMERWAAAAKSPFHTKVLENFRKNREGVRIRLPFRHAIQKHDACLPTSLSSALAAVGVQIDPDSMAAELTFGGTPEWAAAEWLQRRGLEVRFFAVTPDLATQLIKHGIAFSFTLDADASAHAVAAVGLDEAAGTLIVHDPQGFRATEYLLDFLGKDETPLGPKAMAVVPPDKAALLDQLLPRVDVEAMTAREAYDRACVLHGVSTAGTVVADLARRHPQHPITRLLQALQNLEEGRTGEALTSFQQLLSEFPRSAFVRSRLLSSCRAVGNTALMRETIAAVVERGALPGIQAQQQWIYPPGAYVSEYADLLRLSADTREKARSLLHSVLRIHSTCAEAWHNLGDLLRHERDLEGALLGYRIATRLASNNEHYAFAYCSALSSAGRENEGLQWLEERVRRFGRSSHAIAPWVTWINALEDLGHPEEALRVSQQALEHHHAAPELLAFVIPFLARMGQWEEAKSLLNTLETGGNSTLFHQAAVDFFRMRGELDQSIQHAEAWLAEVPLYMRARYQLVALIAKRDGTAAAIACASRWLAEHPGHDELEELYCRQLDRSSAPDSKKYRLLLRRVKRNPQDGWAWREIAFASIQDYDSAVDQIQPKIERRLARLMAECDRTAPDDPATLRLHAQWLEARGQWKEAIEAWLRAIDRDPENTYSYRHAWECSARLDAAQRKELWERMQPMLLSSPGHLTTACDVIMWVAQRFGVNIAEEAVSKWRETRRDDPEVIEASVDLLLRYGHGRSDAERALEILKPAVEHFPYHAGLRFSLADALRQLGAFEEAEHVLYEIVRRHPDNSAAQIQLAWVHERHGRTDQALSVLKSAASGDPQNTEIRDAEVQILIRAGRFQDAKALISDLLKRFAEDVHWRERAIGLLLDCGDPEAAVAAAREGVVVYPRGAYLWLLLGRTLNNERRLAAQGEIENCFRRSLGLNQGLFDAADRLAMLLIEQRQWSEAENVMLRIQKRMTDPSPAQGRLAWIHRQQGKKPEALDEMNAVVQAVPWYRWGWNVLMQWLVEDQAWKKAKSLLGTVPPELRTDTEFRRERLVTLEKGSLPGAELDSEWSQLLRDFPEELSLHLIRYNSLRDAKRGSEAATVLKGIRAVHPNSPYVLARCVEVLSLEGKKTEAIDVLLRLFFAEVEESTWPARYAWDAVKNAQVHEQAYQAAKKRLLEGSRPTPCSLSIMATYALERAKTTKRALQPHWRTWFPDRGAREVLLLLKAVDSAPWGEGYYRAELLKHFVDFGYHRLTIRYWKGHRQQVDQDIDCWSQVGRALVGAHDRFQARVLFAEWRDRVGVAMWMVTNYVLSLSPLRSSQLSETLASCQDALLSLPHDHCAKYLVHRMAEACALLDDQSLFMETWSKYKSYFTEKLDQGEWFEANRKYLLAEIPIMAECVEQNRRWAYRRKVWGLKWKRLFSAQPAQRVATQRTNWWWIAWLIIWLLITLSRLFQSHQ